MTEAYTCPVCKHKITGDIVNFLDHTKEEMVDILKQKYPDWNEGMGLCPKCKEKFETWFDQDN